MKEFEIPQRKLKARVFLEDGRDLEGLMFLPAENYDGQPAQLVDELNNEDRGFVPLSVGQKTYLLNLDRIVRIAIPPGQAQVVPEGPHLQQHLLKVELSGGASLIGHLSYQMPVERQRLRDFLSVEKRFIAVAVDEKINLVRRDHIVTVLALSDEQA